MSRRCRARAWFRLGMGAYRLHRRVSGLAMWLHRLHSRMVGRALDLEFPQRKRGSVSR